jgi:magnesium transporter
VNLHLLDHQGRVVDKVDRAFVESRLASGEFFWLDMREPSEEEFALLREIFRFHPLAVEDSEHFGQRPKLEEYGEVVFLVLYGAAPEPDEDQLVEVHCFYSERFLVTVRRDEAPACEFLRELYARHAPQAVRPIVLLYRLADALADSFFPVLESLDDRLETLEDEVIERPQDAVLEDVFALRRRLVTLRHAITPQRDLIEQIAAGLLELPDLDDEARRYFRDVHDHLTRATEAVDIERDLLTGAMDVYLSSSSNRLNVTVKQLTVIATIFLPLTFVTGYFGQNFGWMVDHVGSLGAFLALGIGLQLVAVVVLLGFFKRRGWF